MTEFIGKRHTGALYSQIVFAVFDVKTVQNIPSESRFNVYNSDVSLCLSRPKGAFQ